MESLKKRLARGHCERFSFELVMTNNNNESLSLNVVNVGDKSFDQGDDIICFHIHLENPCNIATTGSKLITYYDNVPKFCFTIIAPHNHKNTWIPGGSDRKFLTFTTHVLELDSDTNELRCIMIIFENNRLNFDDFTKGHVHQIEPHLDDLLKPPQGINYITLPITVPLHPADPLLEQVSLEHVSQRTPLWFALRTDESFSGTMCGKFAVGYWLKRDEKDRIAKKQKPVHDVIKDNLRQTSNMRMGRIREDEVLCIAMHNFIGNYYETGYSAWDVINRPDLQQYGLHTMFPSKRWGCSPDGLFESDSLTWDVGIPAKTRNHYSKYAPHIDPKRCVLEFKVSFHSSSFPDYYIPQLYWEMIATGSVRSILVRYKRCNGQRDDGKWGTVRVANAYEIYRDPDVEHLLIENIKKSLSKPPEIPLLQFIEENPSSYKKLEKIFAAIAESTEAIPLKIPTVALEAMEKKRHAIMYSLKIKNKK